MSAPAATRRVLRAPGPWAALCAVIAFPFFVTDGGMGFFPFLLTLVGGLLSGAAFVALTDRIRSPRRSIVAHLAGILVGGGTAFAIMRFVDGADGAIDRPVLGALVFAQAFLAPAAGWMVLTLIARISARVAQPSQPALPLPGWRRDGERWVIAFTAVPMRVRTLTWMILAVLLVTAAATVLLFLIADSWLLRLGPVAVIVPLAVVIVLPGYLVLRAIHRRRAVPVRVEWAPQSIAISAGASSWSFPLHEIDRLRWREDTDYARIEVASASASVTLMTGLLRSSRAAASTLPPLREEQIAALRRAGLRPQRSRRPARAVLFVRE